MRVGMLLRLIRTSWPLSTAGDTKNGTRRRDLLSTRPVHAKMKFFLWPFSGVPKMERWFSAAG